MQNKKLAVTAAEAAEIYGLSKGSLANLRWAKKGPRFYKQSRKIFYKVADLENWLFANPTMTLNSHLDR